MPKSRQLSGYEEALMGAIGAGLTGAVAGPKVVAELELRAAAGDRLAEQFIRFYAARGATDAYNRHWHQRLAAVIGRAGTAMVRMMQGRPARDANGVPVAGAVQTALFDFETVDDLRALRLRVERSVNGGQALLGLIDAVIEVRERHPGLSGRAAAALERLDPDAATLDITAFATS